MNILLSNDDGYKSLGLKALKNALGIYGKVTTVAPSRDISASSSCLSVHSPVKTLKIDNNFYKCYGTPADCVHIGSRGLMNKHPQIVFSGINFGSNMGDDVIYSGTVGAAIEGRHAEYGSYAISIASKIPKYREDIALKSEFVIKYIFDNLVKHKCIYNINIPDLPFSKIKGIKFTKLGKRKISCKAKKIINDNKVFFNIGGVGAGINKMGSDFHAINCRYISVTPIKIDMTDSITYENLKNKL